LSEKKYTLVKLRNGPQLKVDNQIIRWREKRKKLGLYKPARNRKPKVEKIKENIWNIFKQKAEK